MKTALTIAGSDASGGAGIQADIKTMQALGVYAMSAIVSVVAENTSTVIEVRDMDVDIINKQIDAVFTDIFPDAVKVGMLSGIECMKAVSLKLKEYKPKYIVIDPVMYAKNGCPLMHEDAVEELIEDIIPLASVLTPNIPEAERIANMKIRNVDDMKEAALKIYKMGAKSVLVKGGHYIGDALDVFYDGKDTYIYKTERIETKNTHGTGCTLSSAIASYLALGEDFENAIKLAKDYVTGAIKNALDLGHGCGPTNHFYDLYERAKMNGKNN